MKGIILKPEPFCPSCGGRMKLKRPRPDQDWEPFWGCMNYPNCKGTRNIDEETGKALDSYEDIDPSLDD